MERILIIRDSDGRLLQRKRVAREEWMDDTDFDIVLAETVTQWASDMGYVYDDIEWEWI